MSAAVAESPDSSQDAMSPAATSLTAGSGVGVGEVVGEGEAVAWGDADGEGRSDLDVAGPEHAARTRRTTTSGQRLIGDIIALTSDPVAARG
jgi:hypothetical protein